MLPFFPEFWTISLREKSYVSKIFLMLIKTYSRIQNLAYIVVEQVTLRLSIMSANHGGWGMSVWADNADRGAPKYDKTC